MRFLPVATPTFNEKGERSEGPVVWYVRSDGVLMVRETWPDRPGQTYRSIAISERTEVAIREWQLTNMGKKGDVTMTLEELRERCLDLADPRRWVGHPGSATTTAEVIRDAIRAIPLPAPVDDAVNDLLSRTISALVDARRECDEWQEHHHVAVRERDEARRERDIARREHAARCTELEALEASEKRLRAQLADIDERFGDYAHTKGYVGPAEVAGLNAAAAAAAQRERDAARATIEDYKTKVARAIDAGVEVTRAGYPSDDVLHVVCEELGKAVH